MNTQIFDTYIEFLQRDDKKVNGVTKEFAEKYENWQHANETNVGCWNCLECSACVDCECCHGCIECRLCTKLKKSKKIYNNSL